MKLRLPAVLVALSLLSWDRGGPRTDADNGGLVLPDGFGALVVVDSLPGKARHLAVSPEGFVYVKGRRDVEGGMNWALQDTDGDGKADVVRNFGPYAREGSYSTGMRIHNGYLYTGSEKLVYRYHLKPGELVPTSPHEVIVVDSSGGREHMAKPIAFDGKGNLYVPFGGPSDACQMENRVPGSPGRNPCPLLDSNAGVWRFEADRLNQFRSVHGTKVATGVRSIVGMEWNARDDALYAVVHGRDNLSMSWPDLFTPWQNAVLPAEGLYKLKTGADAGWPYYYYDQTRRQLMLNPEYGGDGKIACKDSGIIAPLVGFPGHFAPNDMLFYKGRQFPERYRNGAFIAFHGSTIRSPYPQGGYFVAFVPFVNGKPGRWEVFADGFTGRDTVLNTSDARFRPMGLAEGPDGSLYISESVTGRIWRVLFKGDRKSFGSAQLSKMKARENRTYIKNPDPVRDDLTKTSRAGVGQVLYQTHCRVCHQNNGRGDGTRYPPLTRSEWVMGDRDRLIRVMLEGLSGPIEVDGKAYNNPMPHFAYLTDPQVADVLNYVRNAFGNSADSLSAADVARVREVVKKPQRK